MLVLKLVEYNTGKDRGRPAALTQLLSPSLAFDCILFLFTYNTTDIRTRVLPQDSGYSFSISVSYALAAFQAQPTLVFTILLRLIILTTASMSTFQAPSSPLHLLANVVIDMDARSSTRSESPSSDSSSGSSSLLSGRCSTPTSFSSHVTRLHIPCAATTRSATQAPKPLSRTTSSNQLPSADPNFVPYVRHKKKGRKNTELRMKSRMQMKTKRRELLEKATKIKSLDNSPVNERQLLVLRMIYDEITMYPCESWMVLVAIIINRCVSSTISHRLVV